MYDIASLLTNRVLNLLQNKINLYEVTPPRQKQSKMTTSIFGRKFKVKRTQDIDDLKRHSK